MGIHTVDEELLRQLEIMAPDQKRQVSGPMAHLAGVWPVSRLGSHKRTST